ncbi:MAG: hypothetical protein IAX21_11370 [Candidatus Bathyarchaeota archaeon]|nr:hypothetical protein [Candidatus Bathyarchaeum tardum]WNZ29209.1 MAG: hypothetical protein IAX21_11370 [Candidatus Bathyarchaeota archaeon]
MGGGKKNKSLKQMTKTKEPKEKREKKEVAPVAKKQTLGLTVPDVNDKKVLAELKGLKVLTPSVVASRLSIKLSIANAFLKEMEKRKLVEYVSGGKNLKIYKQLVVAEPAK